jgi:glycosyltransferase involved in cell wall biosynthesis
MSAERLRVVHLIDQLNPGGAERFTMDVVALLNAERFDRTICETRATKNWFAGNGRDEALRGLDDRGVRVIELRRTGRLHLRAWLPLIRFLRREHVQVIHAHMFGSSVWATIIGRLCRVPIVVAHEHGSPERVGRLRGLIERLVLARGVDTYLAVSDDERRRLIDLRGIPEHKARVLHNGITATSPTPDRDVRGDLGIPADAPVVITVGVHRPEKAFDHLICAMTTVRERVPGVRLVLVGDGMMRAELEALTAQLGLEDTVVFAGSRSDVPDLLEAADVAVNSSVREGSPLSVLEYMEAGLPVVASLVGGLPDIVVDGVTGVLVPPGDEVVLGDTLAELLLDPDRARAMGERGRERRRAEFDLSTVARHLEELYDELRSVAS